MSQNKQQFETRDLATLRLLLRSLLTELDSTPGAPPVLSPVPHPEPGMHSWHRLSFPNLPEFQLFVGNGMKSADVAEAQVESSKRLSELFASLANTLSEALGTRVTSPAFEEVSSIPDDLRFVQVQGAGSDDGMLVAITKEAGGWLTSHIPLLDHAGTGNSPRLDALMEVELPVSILLASMEASLGDVLQWGPGLVVQFDTGLEDPVEVMVNKQVVARGTVVMVDGNYGIRVTEVLAGSPAVGGRAN